LRIFLLFLSLLNLSSSFDYVSDLGFLRNLLFAHHDFVACVAELARPDCLGVFLDQGAHFIENTLTVRTELGISRH
jgi:hypothetical protein